MIERGTGNLLDARVEALVNTVNTEGVMGKGIALQFKRAFPENFREYERACKRGEVRVGHVFIVPLIASPRYIINFPTKASWRRPSKLDYVHSGLKDLVAKVTELKIKSIALPPLGCGNGGLRWTDVRPVIVQAFASLNDVRVVLYEPADAPPPERQPNRTARPMMTPGRAAILALMHRYHGTGYDYPLTLVEIQKLAYFLQLAGEPLQLEYRAHHHGPYADALRKVIRHIEGHYVTGFGEGRNQPDTRLDLLPGAADEAERFLEGKPTADRLARVANLIEGFETPLGMELLGTVHWAAKDGADLDTAFATIQAWNERKRSLMKRNQVKAAWERLHEQGWL